MEIQAAKKVDPLPGAAPPPPAADPAKPAKYVVLERDLGAMRQPPLVMTIAFSILFALSSLRHAQHGAGGAAEPRPPSSSRPRPRLSLQGATAVPVLAQQLIDASHDGDLAFMAFAFMCFVFVGLLFAIDKVRRRGEDRAWSRAEGHRSGKTTRSAVTHRPFSSVLAAAIRAPPLRPRR